MSRRIRTAVAVVGVASLAITIVVGYAMRAVRQVQPYYAAALEVDSLKLAEESRALECRVAALVSDAMERPSWQAVFSDGEVNGWLAVVLEEKFADLLPEDILDPRITFRADEAVLGFRYQDKNLTTVISVRANVWIAEPDVLAIRLLKAHAGTLPIPLTKIVDPMTEAALKLQIPLRWTQQDGVPVALLSLSGVLDEQRRLDAVELYEGELYLAGSTVENAAVLADEADETDLR